MNLLGENTARFLVGCIVVGLILSAFLNGYALRSNLENIRELRKTMPKDKEPDTHYSGDNRKRRYLTDPVRRRLIPGPMDKHFHDEW